MEKKNIDWSNIGFGYMKTDKRYVSNFKNGAWDEGTLTSDDQITISECAGVLQYAQTCFEGMKAYTTSCSIPAAIVSLSISRSARMIATHNGWMIYGSPDFLR